jgi:hypothetical protein
MYSRSAKGGEKADPNRNPWLAKMPKSRNFSIMLICVNNVELTYELLVKIFKKLERC